jgi:hypothetical protein
MWPPMTPRRGGWSGSRSPQARRLEVRPPRQAARGRVQVLRATSRRLPQRLRARHLEGHPHRGEHRLGRGHRARRPGETTMDAAREMGRRLRDDPLAGGAVVQAFCGWGAAGTGTCHPPLPLRQGLLVALPQPGRGDEGSRDPRLTGPQQAQGRPDDPPPPELHQRKG